MTNAWAGGGDWDVRQEQQQMILQKAYDTIPINAPAEIQKVHVVTQESTEVPNPDIFDKAYVMLRTIVPGWMMALFIVVGAITMATVIFKRQLKNLIVIWGASLNEKGK